MSHDPIDRIATAWEEVGRTDVSPLVARGLAIAFVVMIAAPSLIQVATDPDLFTRSTGGRAAVSSRTSNDLLGAVTTANRRLLSAADRLTDVIGERSLLVETVRPVAQTALTGGLGAGTALVHPGPDGWLFYGPDVRYAAGPGFLSPGHLRRRAAAGDTLTTPPQPDPRVAIVALERQLRDRGITLVVMPTPVKPSVEPDRLGRAPTIRRPAENRSYRDFLDELRARGILVFDVGETLANARRAGVTPLYLKTDTHWRPETVTYVARELAAFVRDTVELPVEPSPGLRATAQDVTNEGDTTRLLDLPPSQTLYPQETVRVRRVVDGEGRPWRADAEAATLLLGDSFTNVYSLETMGWGGAAGLAEQLSLELDRPVDRISQNDAGAHASRELLAADVRRDPGRLDHTRVVVYQFANRELALGDWRRIDLSPAPRTATSAFVPATSGEVLDVEGIVQAVGPIPVPGSVPYKDQIVAVHLSDVSPVSGAPLDGSNVLMYVWGMRDDVLSEVAGWQVGDVVQLEMESWFDVADELDGINRGEIDDPEAQLAAPWWGRLPEGGP